MVILLMVISGYVAVNLMLGNGPRWNAITLYWVVLTIKNALDWGKKRWQSWQHGDQAMDSTKE